MGTSIIETLYAVGQALSDNFFRVIGGQDKNNNAQPFKVGPYNEGYIRNTGENGYQSYVGVAHELKVGSQRRVLGGLFNNTTLDTHKWTSTLANAGTAISGSGVCTLATNTTANGSAILQSVRRARAYSNIGNSFTTAMALGDTGVTNNVRRWGAFDGTNGYYFELNGTTLNLVTLNAGTASKVANGSFTGNAGATITLDTNFHVWEITYQSPTRVEFYLDGVLVHVVTATTVALVSNSDLPARFEDTNSGGLATNHTTLIANVGIIRLLDTPSQPDYANMVPAASTNLTTTFKTGVGTFYGLTVTAGTNGTPVITVYDNTAGSGTIIGTFDGGVDQVINLGTFGIDFFTGITVAITGVGSHPPIITIIYE